MPTKSELAKFFDTKKAELKLTGPLQRHLMQRPPGDRRTDVLHPSEMIKRDWCLRASYFLLNGHTKIAEKPPLRLQNIFDEGHYIHAKWQSYFQEMGVLHGKFKCWVCDKVTWGTSPENCEHCGASSKKLEYAEVTLVDESLRIAGHTDGWVKGLGDDCLIEVKSIGPGTLRSEASQLMFEADGDFMKAWKNVRRPFGPHILQGQMYLELMRRMGNEVEEIVFLYELKADQDYKEFPPIKRDYELVRHIFDKAERLIKMIEEKQVPDCNNNPGSTCKQCEPYKED
jgi:CRISPR/Cas system-associated exonuclease Cas4 (RecB family)